MAQQVIAPKLLSCIDLANLHITSKPTPLKNTDHSIQKNKFLSHLNLFASVFSALFIFLLVNKPENSNNQQLLRKNLCFFFLVSWGGRWNESAAQMSTSGLQGQWLQDSSKNHRSSQYHEAHARNPAPSRPGLVHNMPHFVDFQLLSLTNWFPRPTWMAHQTNVLEFGHCQWIYWQSSIIFADVGSTSDFESAWIFGSHLSPSSH